MTRPARKRVALIVETSNEYARGLLHGIRAYVRERGNWDIDLDERRRGEATGSLGRFGGDGVIARIENAAIAAEVLACRLPCVDVSAARQVPGIPWVETDDAAIARLAFEHLRGRGLRHFAYCGDPNFNWSAWREEAFAAAAAAAGFSCETFSTTRAQRAPVGNGLPSPGGGGVRGRRRAGKPQAAETGARSEPTQAALVEWLRGLPKPVGVMACFDLRGRQLLAAAKVAGFAVPDEVAVIGVDDDELLCDLADPPLSSVAPDTDATGYLAAELLDRMMAGRRVPPTAHLVKPIGVVPRQSTDTLAVADPGLSAAVRYLRAHACEGINVEDVLRQSPGLSRRGFETDFKRLFGHLPHEELVRTRLRRVKELLAQTDLPLHAIADRAGFRHAEYLSVVFKKREGIAPSEFRGRKRRGG
jgi:LacI family transcriptional regulator